MTSGGSLSPWNSMGCLIMGCTKKLIVLVSCDLQVQLHVSWLLQPEER